MVLSGRSAGGTALAGRTDRRVGGHRGGPTAVGGLPRDADGRGGHRRARDPRGLWHAGSQGFEHAWATTPLLPHSVSS